MKSKTKQKSQKAKGNKRGVAFVVICIALFLIALLAHAWYITATIIMIALVMNMLLYVVYELFFGTRGLRALFFGVAGLAFIALCLSSFVGSLLYTWSNPTSFPITATSGFAGLLLLTSMIGLAVGGILYYMAFSAHPLAWTKMVAERLNPDTEDIFKKKT